MYIHIVLLPHTNNNNSIQYNTNTNTLMLAGIRVSK